jgi:hypothetical protein
VVKTAEFERINALPRRVITLSEELAASLTAKLKTKPGTMRLWPIQAAALYEAYKRKGLFAPIGVGHGKTLITLLLPVVLDSKCTVLLVPPQLKAQVTREAQHLYAVDFQVPLNIIHVVSYNDLSLAKTADVLERIKPDLIVADEAHSLKRKDSSRTKRFLRYMKENPSTRFCALSGTVTAKSITDYAHLIGLALKDASPLPTSYSDLMDWAGALDAAPRETSNPGALKAFCLPNEPIRSGYRRRLVETPGVIATEESALGTSLEITRGEIWAPKAVHESIQALQKTWKLGENEIVSATDAARHLRTLSLGFYYVWDWPGGVKDTEWLEKRSEWSKVERRILKYSSRRGLDSPMLVALAASRGQLKPEDQQMWAAWCTVKERPDPPVKPVWVDKFIISHLKSRIEPDTIIWYEWDAFEGPLAELGLPIYGTGTDAGLATAPTIVCSFGSQGTGKNLQRYSKNVFTSWPLGGKLTEQVLGRTHRPGQKEDLVSVEWLSATETIDATYIGTIRDSEYIQATTGQRQKLLLATRINEP